MASKLGFNGDTYFWEGWRWKKPNLHDRTQQLKLGYVKVYDGRFLIIKDLLDILEREKAKPKNISNLEWKKLNKKTIAYNR